MTKQLGRILSEIRKLIIIGDADGALGRIEMFGKLAASQRVTTEERPRLEARIAELRALSEASANGTRRAIEQVREIIQAAHSLQIYNEKGQAMRKRTRIETKKRY